MARGVFLSLKCTGNRKKKYIHSALDHLAILRNQTAAQKNQEKIVIS
jgi:hypothetical protein